MRPLSPARRRHLHSPYRRAPRPHAAQAEHEALLHRLNTLARAAALPSVHTFLDVPRLLAPVPELPPKAAYTHTSAAGRALHVPAFVVACIQLISARGFAHPAPASAVKKLYPLFDDAALHSAPAPHLSALLLAYLDAQPQPLLPPSIIDAFPAFHLLSPDSPSTSSAPSQKVKLAAAQILLRLLPKSSFHLLFYLFHHLSRLHSPSASLSLLAHPLIAPRSDVDPDAQGPGSDTRIAIFSWLLANWSVLEPALSVDPFKLDLASLGLGYQSEIEILLVSPPSTPDLVPATAADDSDEPSTAPHPPDRWARPDPQPADMWLQAVDQQLTDRDERERRRGRALLWSDDPAWCMPHAYYRGGPFAPSAVKSSATYSTASALDRLTSLMRTQDLIEHHTPELARASLP
ncbi:hypothetical protein BOTBODRAFT_34373 [Botryobasidium botryosum FD-172 SS1]|uniref:Rho-GAP domain-containing protein n=1 Tax=Botryobasidium botryosum (strain FD-172 SS1) TaxID=930990 RepID=A0A067MLG2_BOTB1|nr:hypothetical protein BOTBODRAFT_34373 [Botryobasidium botryosum FD-172 SS1]